MWVRDVLIVAGVAVIQVVGSFGAAHGETGHRSLDALAIVLLLAGPALLIFRHRAPSAVLVGVLGITLLYFVRDYASSSADPSAALSGSSSTRSGIGLIGSLDREG